MTKQATNGPLVHVITGLGTGGTENALYRLLAAGDPARHPPLVVSLGSGGTVGPRLEALGIAVVALGMRPGRPTLSGLRRLARLMRDRRPALVQGWMYHGNVVAAVAARVARCAAPLIWNVRHSVSDITREKRSTALLIRWGRRFRSVRRIVYNSRVAAAQHEALGYPADRTRIIPNGFDTGRFRPSSSARDSVRRELGLAPDTPLIGLVARFHPDKDHATFLDAAAELLGERADVHFALIGPGVDAANPALAARLHGLAGGSRIHLLGEREGIERYTAAFDVASCSSVGEALPNAVGEALACGVPCVATDVGDTRELLGGCGSIVPAGDPPALAAGWRELLALTPAGRRELGVAGRARIERDYGLERLVARYAALYDELLDAPVTADESEPS